jgi:hypothetical protein
MVKETSLKSRPQNRPWNGLDLKVFEMIWIVFLNYLINNLKLRDIGVTYSFISIS